MGIRVTISNDEPAGSATVLAVVLVTVGSAEQEEQRHELRAGSSVQVSVDHNQFVMVDEKDSA